MEVRTIVPYQKSLSMGSSVPPPAARTAVDERPRRARTPVPGGINSFLSSVQDAGLTTLEEPQILVLIDFNHIRIIMRGEKEKGKGGS